MDTNTEIFKQFAEVIVPQLKEVSKRFADSIEYEATEKRLIISADPHIGVLVHGRPPTSANPVRGPKSLQQLILEWIPTRSIVPRPDEKGRIPTVEQLSWAISKSIHMKGDLLYRRGGGSDIFDQVISKDRIESLLTLLEVKYYNLVKTINLPKK